MILLKDKILIEQVIFFLCYFASDCTCLCAYAGLPCISTVALLNHLQHAAKLYCKYIDSSTGTKGYRPQEGL